MKYLVTYDDGYSINREHYLDSFLQGHINEFEAAAAKFAVDCIQDAGVRQKYMDGIKRMSASIMSEVNSGKVTVQKGAQLANELRNRMMEEMRVASTPQIRKYAELKKPHGWTIEALLEKYAQKDFKKPFSLLTEQEKTRMYYKVIASSGRADIATNDLSKVLRVAGKVCIVITASLAAHTILMADNKAKVLLQQSTIIGSGLAAGKAGAAVATPYSPLCGPWAPVCIVAGALIAALAGGFIAREVVEYFDDEVEEFLRWAIY